MLEEVGGRHWQGSEIGFLFTFCTMHPTLQQMCQGCLLMSGNSVKLKTAWKGLWEESLTMMTVKFLANGAVTTATDLKFPTELSTRAVVWYHKNRKYISKFNIVKTIYTIWAIQSSVLELITQLSSSSSFSWLTIQLVLPQPARNQLQLA